MSEIRNRYTGEVICSGECSVKELAETNKANLSRADMYGADLSLANLSGADMYGTNLYGAKYGEEELLKYLSINPIGSRNDALQIFITNENIYLMTGCWLGSPEELLERTDREDYKLAVQYILGMAEMVRKEVQG